VIEPSAFARAGVVRVSLPPSLRKLDVGAFRGTPLTLLDLSASASVTLGGLHSDLLEVSELGLPREGFAELAAGLLPRVEVFLR
jgi:hypothetical protein